MKKIGLTQSKVDPCLFVGPGPIFIGTYVDDNFILGEEKQVENTIRRIENEGLKLTIQDGLDDYLSCNIVFDEGHSKAWIVTEHYGSVEEL